MKNFKPGQKVAFISSSEQGIITKIEGDIVFVRLEDGFEIPAYNNDLLILSQEIVEEEEKLNEVFSSKLKRISSTSLAKGLYLAVIASEEEPNLFEVYLINFSAHAVAFHLLSQQGKTLQTLIYDMLPAGQAMLIMFGTYEELSKHQAFKMQFMFIDDKTHVFYDAPVVHFDVRWNKLLTKEVFQNNPFFDEKAYIIKIIDFAEALKPIGSTTFTQGKSSENMVGDAKKLHGQKTSFFIDAFQVDEETAEVDLHAEKLFPDYKKMLPAEILSKQIMFAKQSIDSARQKGLKRLILIHGVGSGALKNELYNLLRKEDDIRFGEANFLKYGVGAIEIIF